MQNIFIIDKSICGCTLRTGAIITSILYILLGAAHVYEYGVNGRMDFTGNGILTTLLTYIFMIAGLAIMMFSVLLLAGILLKLPQLVFAWEIAALVFLVFDAVAALLMFITSLVHGSFVLAFVFLIGHMLFLCIWCYCLILVDNYYGNLQVDNENENS